MVKLTKVFSIFLTSNRNIQALCIASFVGALAYGVYSPYFPLFADGLGADAIELGLVFSTSSFASMIAYYPSGVLADHVGRKKVILVGWSLIALGFIFYIIAPHWIILIPGIFLLSMGATIVDPAVSAIVADSATEQDRSTIFALTSTFGRIPLIFAPLVGSFLLRASGFRILLLTAFSLYLSRVFLFTRFARETVVRNHVSSDKERVQRKYFTLMKQKFATAFSNRTFLLVTLVGSLWVFLYSQVIPFYAWFATKVVGVDEHYLGLMYILMSVAGLLITIPGGKLADLIGRKIVVVTGEVIALATVLFFALATQAYHLLIIGTLFGIAGMGEPAYDALVTETVSKEERGTAIGIMETVTTLVGIPAPLFGGFLWQNIDVRAPFYFAAILNILALSIFVTLIPETGRGRILSKRKVTGDR